MSDYRNNLARANRLWARHYDGPAHQYTPAEIHNMISGAVAEVDPIQVLSSRSLTPAQRVAQAASMIRAAESVAAHRLRYLAPELSEREALLIVRQGGIIEYRRRQREQPTP